MEDNRFLAPPEPADRHRQENLDKAILRVHGHPLARPQSVFAKNYASAPVMTRAVDLVHERANGDRLQKYVEQYRTQLIDQYLQTRPDLALMSLKILRGGEQNFHEAVAKAVSEIGEEQRGHFLQVLRQVQDDRPMIEQYSEAMGDHMVRPDPWDDWRTVGKAVTDFRFLHEVKKLLRKQIDA